MLVPELAAVSGVPDAARVRLHETANLVGRVDQLAAYLSRRGAREDRVDRVDASSAAHEVTVERDGAASLDGLLDVRARAVVQVAVAQVKVVDASVHGRQVPVDQ